MTKLDEKIWLSELHFVATFLHPSTKSLSVSADSVVYRLNINRILMKSIAPNERKRVMDSVRQLFITLGINDEVGKEENRSADSTNQPNSMQKKVKKQTKKQRIGLDVHNILQSYDADNYAENLDDDHDEVDQYFKMKLSIKENESILQWWKDRTLLFPR